MPTLTETLTIENVVASASLEQEVDLESLAHDLDDVRFEPDQFPGLICRTHNPKATSLLFRSGKIVCTGASSVDNVERSILQTFDALQELGIEVADDPEITVQNIVTCGDLGEQLRLNAVAIGFGLENVEYEPEQFPGLVYRPEGENVVILLFGSGKVVITGGKRPADAEQAIESVFSRLHELDLL